VIVSSSHTPGGGTNELLQVSVYIDYQAKEKSQDVIVSHADQWRVIIGESFTMTGMMKRMPRGKITLG
jgi:hypothetical protein